jgi:Protein of unknown function (DUF2846)
MILSPAPHQLLGFLARSACILILPLSALAQSQPVPAPGAPGCGPTDIRFEVTTSKSQNPPSKADAGKALVYFLQDDTNFNSRPRPSTLVGLDGQWIGATNANSYLYFPVDPGEHHLCTNWQGFSFLGKTRTSGALHFTAEAGGVYYFRAKDIYVSDKYFDLKLKQVDSDEGQLLVSKFSFSSSHPKK